MRSISMSRSEVSLHIVWRTEKQKESHIKPLDTWPRMFVIQIITTMSKSMIRSWGSWIFDQSDTLVSEVQMDLSGRCCVHSPLPLYWDQGSTRWRCGCSWSDLLSSGASIPPSSSAASRLLGVSVGVWLLGLSSGACGASGASGASGGTRGSDGPDGVWVAPLPEREVPWVETGAAETLRS